MGGERDREAAIEKVSEKRSRKRKREAWGKGFDCSWFETLPATHIGTVPPDFKG